MAHPGSLLRLLRQYWWLAGTGVLFVGYALQAVALDNGRLSVIQPLLVTTIVFALPLGYLITAWAGLTLAMWGAISISLAREGGEAAAEEAAAPAAQTA